MPTKTAQAYRRIKGLIENGYLVGGERLTEARASELVGMTRGPIRESLRRLEADGLLKNRGVRRSRVIIYAEDQEPEEMLYRYELREAIEGTAARLAANNMTGWQIRRLRELNQELDEAMRSDDSQARGEASKRFHYFLMTNCGNPLLLQVWQTHRLIPLRMRSRKLNDRIKDEVARKIPENTNAAVVEAIAAHDPDQADKLMRQRIRAVSDVIRRIMMAEAEGGRPGKLPVQ